MLVDTSAIIAILANEPDAEAIASALAASSERNVSAATLVEAGIVVRAKWGDPGVRQWERSQNATAFHVVPVDAVIARSAVDAYARFGKGRHPAALNFGDCFVYGTAVTLNLPLLCKGNDFTQTDLTLVDVSA